MLYSLRRWLFQLLAPKEMFVYLYRGAEYVTLCDDDTKQVWGMVRLEWANAIYTFTETYKARPEDWNYIPPCNADCHQSSEIE